MGSNGNVVQKSNNWINRPGDVIEFDRSYHIVLSKKVKSFFGVLAQNLLLIVKIYKPENSSIKRKSLLAPSRLI